MTAKPPILCADPLHIGCKNPASKWADKVKPGDICASCRAKRTWAARKAKGKS